jgi:hypothetical protein
MVFFATSGPSDLLAIWANSVERLPVGRVGFGADLTVLLEYISTVFAMAFGLAGLVLLVLFLVDLAIAFMSRTLPQVREMAISGPRPTRNSSCRETTRLPVAALRKTFSPPRPRLEEPRSPTPPSCAGDPRSAPAPSPVKIATKRTPVPLADANTTPRLQDLIGGSRRKFRNCDKKVLR